MTIFGLNLELPGMMGLGMVFGVAAGMGRWRGRREIANIERPTSNIEHRPPLTMLRAGFFNRQSLSEDVGGPGVV
jgi:hypothetical protein